MSYRRFAAMVGTSTMLMFGLMYSTVYALDHVRWSETMFYMALYMGAVMAVVMLSFMWKMYPSRAANVGIVLGAVVIIAGGLALARSQKTVQDISYMRSMIPHHSVAILTSERAEISDPRVQRLADQIIQSQTQEIAEMEELIDELESR